MIRARMVAAGITVTDSPLWKDSIMSLLGIGKVKCYTIFSYHCLWPPFCKSVNTGSFIFSAWNAFHMHTISSQKEWSARRGLLFCDKLTVVPGLPGKDQGDEQVKNYVILIGMLLLIALPAGAMAACSGSCGSAVSSRPCQTSCVMGSYECTTQITCANQIHCPQGGQGCGTTGCSTSTSCISAGCTDGTACSQMQAYCDNIPRIIQTILTYQR